MKNSESFWVTNVSTMNVSLADLNVTIKAMSSVDLLNKKHFSFSKEQLFKSFESGSLFKKRNKICVRRVAPEIENKNLLFKRDETFPSRDRSILSIKEENYEELNLSDAEYANQNAELAEMDAQPLIKKG
jgi:hypothetical protein